MSFVLDNSIALSWCFEDERTPETLALLERVVTSGAIAPWLWPHEALNGLLMAERRRRLDTESRHQLIAYLRDLPLATRDNDLRTAATALGVPLLGM